MHQDQSKIFLLSKNLNRSRRQVIEENFSIIRKNIKLNEKKKKMMRLMNPKNREEQEKLVNKNSFRFQPDNGVRKVYFPGLITKLKEIPTHHYNSTKNIISDSIDLKDSINKNANLRNFLLTIPDKFEKGNLTAKRKEINHQYNILTKIQNRLSTKRKIIKHPIYEKMKIYKI